MQGHNRRDPVFPLHLSPCRGMGCRTAPQHGELREVIAMCNGHKATGMRQKWLGIGVILVALLVTSAVPGHAWRGGHGGHGFRHGGHGHWHGWHGYYRPSVVFSVGPYWAPYWDPYWAYGYPPAVATVPPQVYVQPAPQTPAQPGLEQSPVQPYGQPSWYYCDDPQGYYPYVQQCPGGWRPVAPTPPSP